MTEWAKVRLAQSVSIACKGTEKAAGQQFDPEIVRTKKEICQCCRG
jgi:hypothetical protein